MFLKMKLHVNDMEVMLSEEPSITGLLKQLSRNEKGIAVAVNEEVVARSDWDSKLLHDADRIMIIQATQGG